MSLLTLRQEEEEQSMYHHEPTCRKGSMMADSMLLPGYSFLDNQANFMWGGRAGLDYDTRMWKLSHRAWEHASSEVSKTHQPQPRWKGVFLKVDETRIVLFGGSANVADYLNDVWMFHPMEDRWEELETKTVQSSTKSIPARRAHTGVVVNSKSLVVYGGSDGELAAPLNDLWTLDLDTKTWEEHTTLQFPLKPRKGHTAVLVGKQMLVFGGRYSDTEYFNDLVALQFDATWKPVEWKVLTKKNGPGRRNHHVAVSMFDHHMLVYGGRANHEINGKQLNDVWLFDAQAQEWQEVAVLHEDGEHGFPPPRIEAAYATVGDNELVMGFGQTTPKQLLNDLWSLQLHTDLNTGAHHGTWRAIHLNNCTDGHIYSNKHHKADVGVSGVVKGGYAMSAGLALLLLFVIAALYRWRPRSNAGYQPI